MKRTTEIPRPALLLCGLLMVPLLLAGGPAGAVLVDLDTASGQVGDTVSLPVLLTGLADDIYSFELNLTWYAPYAQCVGVTTAGTLSAGFAVYHSPGSGSVRIAGAGAVPISTDGTLLLVDFLLGPNSGNATISVTALLNEGDPVPTTSNGNISITALPVMDVSPDSGLLVVGETLAFSASGGTAPYSFVSSNPAVASFSGGNVLQALSPGSVTVTAFDSGSGSAVTTGSIEVRAFTLQVGSASVNQGETAVVPVTLNDPAGYGITAGEFTLTWYGPYAQFTGIQTAGTIAEAAGWTAPLTVAGNGSLKVVAAGDAPLAGPGVLFYLEFTGLNTTTLTLAANIFNEIYPAKSINGTISVIQPPSVWISPATATMRVGDQQQFTAYGSPTPPLSWSVDDPLLASIDASGKLLALGEGIVHVSVLDDAGISASSGAITICSLDLPALSSSILADEVELVPVTVGRSLDGLDIYSLEISVTYNPASVQFQGVVTAGSVTGAWGAPVVTDVGGTVSVYHAGAVPLAGCAPALFYLQFQGAPSLVSPYTGVSLASALFNEGIPCALINRGTPCADISPVPEAPFATTLFPNHPNPFNPGTVISFRIEQDGPVDLAVYSVRGRLVARLATGWYARQQIHEVSWNGTDQAGRPQPSGIYFCRLVADGRTMMQKMTLVK